MSCYGRRGWIVLGRLHAPFLGLVGRRSCVRGTILLRLVCHNGVASFGVRCARMEQIVQAKRTPKMPCSLRRGILFSQRTVFFDCALGLGRLSHCLAVFAGLSNGLLYCLLGFGFCLFGQARGGKNRTDLLGGCMCRIWSGKSGASRVGWRFPCGCFKVPGDASLPFGAIRHGCGRACTAAGELFAAQASSLEYAMAALPARWYSVRGACPMPRRRSASS